MIVTLKHCEFSFSRSRELLRCEACLANLYCRRSLLSIQKETSASIEPALDHLRVVSAECFAEPLPEGATITTSPDLAPSPTSCLQTLTLSPLPLFYSNPERISQEIATAIGTLTELERLVQSVCACLQRAPKDFGSTELKVTESKETVDVSHPEAAFTVVSVVEEVSDTPPPPRYTPIGLIPCYDT